MEGNLEHNEILISLLMQAVMTLILENKHILHGWKILFILTAFVNDHNIMATSNKMIVGLARI